MFLLAQGPPIPTSTFDWILSHGVTGFALAIVAVLGWFTLKTLQAKQDLETKYADKIEKLKTEYAVKVESLMRDQIITSRQTTKVLAKTVELLQRAGFSMDEIFGSDEGDSK